MSPIYVMPFEIFDTNARHPQISLNSSTMELKLQYLVQKTAVILLRLLLSQHDVWHFASLTADLDASPR